VIRRGPDDDEAIQFIAGRYDMEVGPDAMYGCTYETARELVAGGRHEGLLGKILAKY
jgi:hypothetical protein